MYDFSVSGNFFDTDLNISALTSAARTFLAQHVDHGVISIRMAHSAMPRLVSMIYAEGLTIEGFEG